MQVNDLERHELGNGLQVVLHRDPRLPLVAINLWYHVGSKNEQLGRTGLAHLFEHILFEGSAHVGKGEHFHYVQQAGGVANGSTWYDRTNYYETLPSHQLDLGLWLEADRLGFLLPGLDQDKLDNQRDVVINERRQRVDNQPYGRATERLYELLFEEGHPYRWPVIGSVEDLEATTLDDIRSFFTTYYSPGNAVLTLAGDFEPKEALDKVERWFGDIPAGQTIPRPQVPAAGLSSARRGALHDRVQLPRIYLGMHTPAYGQDAWYAADLLCTALSEGKASVLYEDLVYRRRLAQDVGAYVYPTEESGLLLMVATARPGVEPERLEAALGEHLDRVAREPLAEEHLERARNQLLTQHYGHWQTLEDRANMLSRFATFFDDPAAATDEAGRYRRASAEHVLAFAHDHLKPTQRATLTVLGEEHG